MDFIIVGLLTAIFGMLVITYSNKNGKSRRVKKVIFSQSRTFLMLKPGYILINMLKEVKEKPTQSSKYNDSLFVKVAFFENKAYWIKSNVFYSADIVDGEIDKDSTKQVDTMTMDKVELDKIIFIVEQLTEGNQNDSSSSGNK